MSYQQYRPTSFRAMPPVVLNLLIINGLLYLSTTIISEKYSFDLNDYLGLHYPLASQFRPWQLITYMFMHGSFMHIALNMFALWMFGVRLENMWGSKRFLIYYMATGIGAGIVQMAVTFFRLESLYSHITPEGLNAVMTQGYQAIQEGKNFIEPVAAEINGLINSTTIGASGAVFGILLARGLYFPNELLYLYGAIPLKTKWFVTGYGLIELYSGIANSANDNVAHFAHLGGMLFGFILIKYWQKNNRTIF